MRPLATGLAKQAFQYALDETRRLHHDAVRAEHILLGVLRLPAGSASAALDAEAVDRAAIAHQLEARVPAGETEPHPDEYPYHPSAAQLLHTLFTPKPGEPPARITSGRVLFELLNLEHAPIVEAMTAAGVDWRSLAERLRTEADDEE